MSIKNRLKKLELVTSQADGLHVKVAFGMDTETWQTIEDGRLVPVEDKHPKNILYISEEDEFL
jgi:hypothetical protein